ncbi:ABATE domain-containing protein [Kocuria sp. U4B]
MSHIPLPPAPGVEEHVSLALVNSAVTLPAEQHVDDLASPAEATRWLIDHGLVPEQTALLTYCQNQLAGLRAQVRELFAAHVNGEIPSASTLEAVNQALSRVPSAPVLRHDPQAGFRREQAHPVTQLVEHAMAQIAEDAATLLTSSAAPLITRCHASPLRPILPAHPRTTAMVLHPVRRPCPSRSRLCPQAGALHLAVTHAADGRRGHRHHRPSDGSVGGSASRPKASLMTWRFRCRMTSRSTSFSAWRRAK